MEQQTDVCCKVVNYITLLGGCFIITTLKESLYKNMVFFMHMISIEYNL